MGYFTVHHMFSIQSQYKLPIKWVEYTTFCFANEIQVEL